MLADKAYPGWSNDQRLQLVRDQFVQGLRSSTVQLRLMKEMPDTLDEALKLAIQQESVEAAQKRLSSERGHGSSSLASSSIEDAAAENGHVRQMKYILCKFQNTTELRVNSMYTIDRPWKTQY